MLSILYRLNLKIRAANCKWSAVIIGTNINYFWMKFALHHDAEEIFIERVLWTVSYCLRNAEWLVDGKANVVIRNPRHNRQTTGITSVQNIFQFKLTSSRDIVLAACCRSPVRQWCKQGWNQNCGRHYDRTGLVLRLQLVSVPSIPGQMANTINVMVNKWKCTNGLGWKQK